MFCNLFNRFATLAAISSFFALILCSSSSTLAFAGNDPTLDDEGIAYLSYLFEVYFPLDDNGFVYLFENDNFPDDMRAVVLSNKDPQDLLKLRRISPKINNFVCNIFRSPAYQETWNNYFFYKGDASCTLPYTAKSLLKKILDEANTILTNEASVDEKITSFNELHGRVLKETRIASSLYTSSITPSQKLVNTLVELKSWDQVSIQVLHQVVDQIVTQVRAQVEPPIWAQVGNQVAFQGRDQVRGQVGAQLVDQVRGQVGTQIEAQVGPQVRSQVMHQVMHQFEDQVRDQVRDYLLNYNLTSKFNDGNLGEVVKPAIQYALLVDQLGTVLMRHSPEFKKMQNDLATSISDTMTVDQINTVLSSIEIPPNGDNPLVNLQLEMLRIIMSVPAE